MPFLLIAFIVVPIVEISVIDRVQESLGWPLTLVLLLLDSVIGAVLVRREGRRAWTAFRDAIGSGRWPGDEVTQGGLVLVGGALLVTPGFVTDAVGLAMVLPPTRALMSKVVRRRMRPPTVTVGGGLFGGDPRHASGRGRRADERDSRRPGQVGGPAGGHARDSGGRGGDDVVDVEVVSIEREEDDARGSKGPGDPSGR